MMLLYLPSLIKFSPFPNEILIKLANYLKCLFLHRLQTSTAQIWEQERVEGTTFDVDVFLLCGAVFMNKLMLMN